MDQVSLYLQGRDEQLNLFSRFLSDDVVIKLNASHSFGWAA